MTIYPEISPVFRNNVIEGKSIKQIQNMKERYPKFTHVIAKHTLHHWNDTNYELAPKMTKMSVNVQNVASYVRAIFGNNEKVVEVYNKNAVSCFACKITSGVQKSLGAFRDEHLTNLISAHDFLLGKTVLVKIIQRDKNVPWPVFVTATKREISAQTHAYFAPSTSVQCSTGRTIQLTTRPCIPIPYFAGTDRSRDVAVIAMEFMENTVPKKMVLTNDSIFKNFELALASLWMSAGIAHTDLHANNILVHPNTNHVTIIDFGRAVKLSKKIVDDAKRQFMLGGLDAAWYRVIQPYVNGVLSSRRTVDVYYPRRYYPNGKVLRYMRSKRPSLICA